MGVQIKYVYKGKLTAGGPGAGEEFLAIEHDFYSGIEPAIFFIGTIPDGPEALVWKAVHSLWDSACFAPEKAKGYLHERYRGIFVLNYIVEDKASTLFHFKVGAKSRKTHIVKVAPKACSLQDNVAFVIFEYMWEYTISGKNLLVREDGTYAQTWLSSKQGWKLFGEFGGPITVSS